MGSGAKTLVGVIGVGLATLIAGPSFGADGGSVECDLLDATSPAQVSCTVTGLEGAEFMLVLATIDAEGSEVVTSFSRRSSGDSATFTQLVPEGATRIIATGLVDGTEVDSELISDLSSGVADPIELGVPSIAVAVSALASLVFGALILFFGARKRAVERRGAGPYKGVLT